jgi:hypothetical protein
MFAKLTKHVGRNRHFIMSLSYDFPVGASDNGNCLRDRE